MIASEIITKENERVARLFGSLDRVLSGIEGLVANHRPTLGGERFLTDKEVSARLKVSRRTLQDWRTNGQIAYITLGGKCSTKSPKSKRCSKSTIAGRLSDSLQIHPKKSPQWVIVFS